jgi:hypothetical protein
MIYKLIAVKVQRCSDVLNLTLSDPRTSVHVCMNTTGNIGIVLLHTIYPNYFQIISILGSTQLVSRWQKQSPLLGTCAHSFQIYNSRY